MLLYPQKRALVERVRMSALCQKRTFRSAISLLLDRLQQESLEIGVAHDAVIPGCVETLDLPALLRSMATTPRFTELPSFVHSKPPP